MASVRLSRDDAGLQAAEARVGWLGDGQDRAGAF